MYADDDIYTDRVERRRREGITHTSHPHIHLQKEMTGRDISNTHTTTHIHLQKRGEREREKEERDGRRIRRNGKEGERATHTYRRNREKEERREPSDRGIEEIRERKKRKEAFAVLPRTCRLAQGPGTRLGVTARACQLEVTGQEGSGEFGSLSEGSILVTAVS